jgi:hypothetical protein
MTFKSGIESHLCEIEETESNGRETFWRSEGNEVMRLRDDDGSGTHFAPTGASHQL